VLLIAHSLSRSLPPHTTRTMPHQPVQRVCLCLSITLSAHRCLLRLVRLRDCSGACRPQIVKQFTSRGFMGRLLKGKRFDGVAAAAFLLLPLFALSLPPPPNACYHHHHECHR
jgi:hypothetical protein